MDYLQANISILFNSLKSAFCIVCGIFAVLYVFFFSLFIVKKLLKCQNVLLSKKTMLMAGYILFIKLISQLYFVYFKVIYVLPPLVFPIITIVRVGGLD